MFQTEDESGKGWSMGESILMGLNRSYFCEVTDCVSSEFLMGLNRSHFCEVTQTVSVLNL